MSGWIGVDLDGTLAVYRGWNNGEIGEPVPVMLERVKQWLANKQEVRIFTARVALLRDTEFDFVQSQHRLIGDWCEKHIGKRLAVTAQKDLGMIELWDDRAIRVEANTGRII